MGRIPHVVTCIDGKVGCNSRKICFTFFNALLVSLAGTAFVLVVNIVNINILKRVAKRKLINVVFKAGTYFEPATDTFFRISLVFRGKRTVAASIKGINT